MDLPMAESECLSPSSVIIGRMRLAENHAIPKATNAAALPKNVRRLVD